LPSVLLRTELISTDVPAALAWVAIHVVIYSLGSGNQEIGFSATLIP